MGRKKVKEFDLRESGQAEVNAAVRLTGQPPWLEADFNSIGGTPGHVQALGRFLTTAQPGRDASEVVREYVERNAVLFGHDSEVLLGARLLRRDVSAHNGLLTLAWQQELDGIPVFESVLKANVTKEGQLVQIGSHFIPGGKAATGLSDDERSHLVSQPKVEAAHAVAAAVAALGETAGVVQQQGAREGVEKRQPLQIEGFSDVSAGLAWLPMSADSLRLVWDTVLTSLKHGEMFRVLVDASSGEPLLLRSLTNDISDATYRVFANSATHLPFDSPAPWTPGPTAPSSAQAAEVPRQLITLSAVNTTASPNGWINDGGMETIGNNVAAHTDLDANNIADLPRPNGGAGRVFDFPFNSSQAPSTYRDAAVTQLFYLCNWTHDKLYDLGFTETAGNFQTDNFGRGGAGNDAVLADAQDGNGFNNANFSTPPDGTAGRMQMYVFSGPEPDKDGDFDSQIVIHEYVHGLTNRLVGGGVGISQLQTRGMGEGWSDFYSLAMLAEAGEDPEGTYPSGGYATHLLSGMTSNYYFGIRRFPYGTNMAKSPLTFRDIDPTKASPHTGVLLSPRYTSANSGPDGVHAQGEVWCNMLWEMRRNLVVKHGFAVGNPLALQLVTDGLKLSPANPTFVQARNAIIQADLVNNGAANAAELWTAFAKRGLGVSAHAPAATTTTGVVEAFDLPDDLSVTPVSPFAITGTEGVLPFSPASSTYTLSNSGSGSVSWTAVADVPWLSLSSTSGTLTASSSFEVTASLTAQVATLAAGSYPATISFTNTGNAHVLARPVTLLVNPALVTASFANATTVPITAAGYSATGKSLEFVLGFAPSSGTILTVVNNTASVATPITGTFTNISQGAVISRSFGGAEYRFYANYSGGDGNDFTLSLIPVAQSITFEPIPPKVPTAPNFTLTATANSGLPVSFATAAGPATVNAGVVSLGGSSGVVTIRASQEGNDIFARAPDVWRSFTVGNGFQFAQVFAGGVGSFSYAIKADGTLWSWGPVNGTGSLGDTNSTGRPTPTQIGTATNWLEVSPGTTHCLGLRTDGTLWAWGSNTNGQIGDNTILSRTAPVQIGSGFSWTAIGAGQSFSAAVRSDGTLWTWGINSNGQLGINSTTQSLVPVQVGSDADWSRVACGTFHLVALKTNGQIWSCGQGTSGQLGNGSSIQSLTLVQSGSDTDWDMISAGTSFTMARKTNGTLWAWGSNTSGQLGDGTTNTRNTPAQTGSDSDWTAISAGGSTAAGLKPDGSVWIWGSNASGLFNNDTVGVSRLTPGRLSLRTGWATIRLGSTHVCLLHSDGDVWTAGDALGFTGTSPRALTRGSAGIGAGITAITGSSGTFHALRNNGTLWAWGNNGGSIGDGTTTARYSLVQVGTAADWQQVSSGGNSTFSSSTLAVKTNGTLWAWGGNLNNILGDGTTTTRSSPVQIGTATNWKQVSVGSSHSMAVRTDGTLWGWGLNSSNQLGDGTTTLRTTPVQIGSVTTWKAVACGGSHTLALRTDGTLWGWGSNGSGQIGDGTFFGKNAPVQVGTASDWAEIAAGTSHSVALKTNSTLWTWGQGNFGQQGSGAAITRTVPTQIGTGILWAKVAAGTNSTSAVAQDGGLWVSGQNQHGQNGMGTTAQMNLLTQVGTDRGFVNVAIGATTIAAVRSDGSFWTAGVGFGPRSMAGGRDPRVLSPVLPALATQTLTPPAANYATWQSPLRFATSSGMPARALVVSGPAAASEDGLILTGTGPVVVSLWAPGDDYAWNAIPPTRFTFDSTADLAATLAAPDTVAFTSSGFDARNLNLQLTLGFTPQIGQSLTLVSNTSSGPITGTFPGIPQNGFLALTHNGVTYGFRVNYSGGDGNDIVLTHQVAEQVVTLGPISPKAVSDGSFVPVISNSSTLPVVLEVLAGPASVSNGSVILTGQPGAVTLRASHPGNAKFHPALPVFRTFVVSDQPFRFAQFSLSGGGNHALGIGTNGWLWGWGFNAASQLGDGSVATRFVPIRIGNDSNWSIVASGTSHSLGIRSNGTLWGWGINGAGQIGDGTTNTRTTPVQVGTGSNWTRVSLNGSHSAGIRADGTLWTWGLNGSGQLGLGDTANRFVPTQVGIETNWLEVACGGTHILALKSDGSLWAWGQNASGQVGNGSTVNQTIPVRIGGATTWTQISGGSSYSVAIQTNGTLWAWGSNSSGQLGDGTTTSKSSPIQIGADSDWVQVSAGNLHTLALKASGRAWAWGNNTSAQLGNGNLTNSAIPQPVFTEDVWSVLAAGSSATMGLKADGSLHAWGDGGGYLGKSVRNLTEAIPALPQEESWLSIHGSNAHTLAVRSNGTLWAWGFNGSVQLGTGVGASRDPIQVGTDVDWTSASAGGSHSLGLRQDGSLWGWGSNTSGQVGDGTTTSRNAPVRIGVDNNWTFVSAGSSHTVAVRQNGTLWAWGQNTSSQLGDGSTTQRNSPVQIGSATDWNSAAAAASHTLGLKTDGSLWAWGQGSSGQIGNGSGSTQAAPVRIGTENSWTQIAANGSSSYAIKQDGSLWAWGLNSSGQLGLGDITTRFSPVRVGTANDWARIAAGSSFAAATKTDGSLWVWGNNTTGQLGEGIGANVTTPRRIGLTQGWSLLAAGNVHLTAARTDGSVWTAGFNGGLRLTSASGRSQYLSAPVLPALASQTILPPVVNGAVFQVWAESALPARVSRISGTAQITGNTVTLTGPPGSPVKLLAWQPGDESAWNAALPVEITLNTPDREIAVELSGQPLMDGQSSIAFGQVNLGESGERTLTIRNAGLGVLQLAGATIDGSAPADFSASPPVSGISLAAGESTTLTITFTPSVHGTRQAVLHLLSNDEDEASFDLTLNGQGFGPQLVLESPAGSSLASGGQVTFGEVTPGSSSRRSFTLRNGGGGSLQVSTIGKQGAQAAAYHLLSASPVNLGPGETRSFDVIFAPGEAGAFHAQVQITSNDSASNPFVVNLSGTGVQATSLASLVKDINITPGGSNPTPLVLYNGRVLFGATTLETGYELWSTDGTEGGTSLVKDIHFGSTDGLVSTVPLVEWNGLIYFSASTADEGAELWRTDGTSTGTLMVKDINPTGSSSLSGLLVYNGALYFAANDGASGTELWRSDGTEAGTVKVLEINPGSASAFVTNLTVAAGWLFFSAHNGVQGVELWRSDGTAAGTTLVRDINVGTGGTSFASLRALGGQLVFVATTSTSGAELWRSDGTEAGTEMIGDINPGSASSSPANLTVMGNHVYFAANNGTLGIELWRSDGTTAFLVRDIATGTGSSQPSQFKAVGDTFYFQASQSGSGAELWKTDGTEAGTVMVKDIIPGAVSSSPTNLAALDSILYFRANSTGSGLELWRSDGTDAGTFQVTEINPGSASASPNLITVLGGSLYFQADNGGSGMELWRSDGTAAGTAMVTELSLATNAASIGSLRAMNGLVFFPANDGISGSELWRSDGTSQGTFMLRDFNPGLFSGVNGAGTILNGNMYFQASSGGQSLWKTDGSISGTVQIHNFGSANTLFPWLVSGSHIYFSLNAGTTGHELWRTDGTSVGTVLVKDVFPGAGGSIPMNLTDTGSGIFFSAASTQGIELWRTDGTEVGTTQVKDINPGAGSSSPASLVNVSGTLFFQASDGVTGRELWKSDGTEAGTVLVKDINPGNSNGTSGPMFAVDSRVFFQADDGVNGSELWVSDGTESGTYLVRDLASGASSSSPSGFATINGRLYFSATDGIHGNELWTSDGTSEGTWMVKDIFPGFGSSSPSGFTLNGQKLFFIATTPGNGQELLTIDLAQSPDIALEHPPGSNLIDGLGQIAFGTTGLGMPVGKTVIAKNTASGSLQLTSASITGPSAAEFSISPLPGAPLPLLGIAPLVVTFNPSTVGPKQAMLRIYSNDPEESPFEVTLSGDALLPQAITFQEIPQQTCGIPLILTASSSSSLPVTFVITQGQEIAEMSSGTVEFNAAGTVTIEARQPGDSLYAAALTVSRTFAVVRGDQLLTFAPSVPASISHRSTVTLAATSDKGLSPLVFSLVSGAATLDGTLLQFNGPGEVVVQVTQAGNARFNPGLAQAVILATNAAPVAASGTAQGNEDNSIIGILQAQDADGDNFTFVGVANATHGNVVVNANGTFSYTPILNYNGPDSFTFKANDGLADSNIATISITVHPVNDAPVSAAGTASGDEDNVITGQLAATDIESDALTYTRVANATHGNVLVNSDGSFSYTPVLNYNGPDSFTFKANDGLADSNVATISITVHPVNDAPVAVAGTASGDEDNVITGQLAATDIESDALTYTRVANATHGNVLVNSDGSFSYTPVLNYNGPDSFTFKANDGLADSNIATISITVHPVNDAPVAVAQSVTTFDSLPLNIMLSGTDVDENALTYVVVTPPSHGELTGIPPALTFQSEAGYAGNDSFTFKANDGLADSAVVTIQITINPVAPVITSEPSGSVVNPGSQVVIEVGNTGSRPLHYLWRKDGQDLDAPSEPILILESVEESDEGEYDVLISNVVGTATSRKVMVSINDPIVFNQHPGSRRVSETDEVVFAAEVTGTGPWEFQWRKNGEDLPGERDSELRIESAARSDEGTYDVVVTNIVGSYPSQPATLVVIEGDPSIEQEPLHQLVQAGDKLTLEVSALGRPPLRYQWQRNGVDIAKATTPKLEVYHSILTDAGTYRVKVTSATTKISQEVQVGVVVNSPTPLVLAKGVGTSLRVNAAGTGLAFSWEKHAGSLPDSGRSSLLDGGRTLKLTGLQVADAGLYRCIVTGPGGTVIGGSTQLSVVDALPLLADPQDLPDGIVGGLYRHAIVYKPEAQPINTPSRFTATGLPSGVKINSLTGLIEGYPVKDGKFKVVITATNKAGSQKVTEEIQIAKFPGNVAGVYLGFVGRLPSLNAGLGGRLELTITTTGALTGKLIMGTITYALKSSVNVDKDGVLPPRISIQIPRTGWPRPQNLTLDLEIDSTQGRLVEARVHAGEAQASVTGWRHPGSMTTAYTGYHTLALELPETALDDPDIPQGNGYGTFTLDTKGAYRLTGAVADGTTFTISGFASSPDSTGNCQLGLFSVLYGTTNPGSLEGLLILGRGANEALQADNTLSGSPGWSRPDQRPKNRTTYAEGFGPLTMTVLGGAYVAPPLILGIPTAGSGVAELTFPGAGAGDSATPPGVALDIDIKNKLKISGQNLAATSLTITHANGLFSGGFTLKDPHWSKPAPNIWPRKTSFKGVILRHGGSWIGCGAYMLPDLPIDDPRFNPLQIRSGQARLHQLIPVP